MSHSIAFIGSFQKFYEEIRKLIKQFSAAGITTLSPYDSPIVDVWDVVDNSGFVVTDQDDKTVTSAEIQMDTLKRILKADAVYVYNPEGYVGKTTCYEIGVIISKRRPLYFYSMPKDVPIPISERQIVNPGKMIDIIKSQKANLVLPNNLSKKGLETYRNVFENPRHHLLLCGSMKFYQLMKSIKHQMEKEGIVTTIPEDEDGIIDQLNQEEMEKFKRRVSSGYLRKIRDKNTSAILVVNEEKNGIPNYIGANTLVEIGMAFTWGKKIFLYNQVYTPLKDELQAWGCVSLDKDLTAVFDYFSKCGIAESDNNVQITMFDDLFL